MSPLRTSARPVPGSNGVHDHCDEGGRRPRVLVVEDAAAILALMVDAFGFDGYQAHGTLDAAEAERLITTESFDVIVSDLVMPGLSGFSLLATARRGAFRVLRKPFPPRVLLDVVREALRAR